MPSRVRHYATLDAFRGLAAILVMLGHSPTHPISVPYYYLGVDLFFGMSGFVIAHGYEARMRERLSAGRFMALRAARLWPMIVFGGILGALVSSQSLAIVFLLPGDEGFIANPPFWSLRLEIIAYLVFALVLYRLSNRSLLFLWLAVACMAGWFAFTLPDYNAFDGGTDESFGTGLVRVCYHFGFGMLLYRFRGVGPASAKASWWPWLLLPAFAAMLLVELPMGGMIQGLVGVPLFVCLASRFELTRTWLAKRLADISYPLYCLHWPILIVWYGFGGAVWAAWPALIALSLVVHRSFDMPMARKLKAIAEGRSGHAPPRVDARSA